MGYPDPELRFLPALCTSSRIAIDVGASLGLYTLHLLAYARGVWAFEPRSAAADELVRTFAAAPVRVHHMALSDIDGEASITICDADLGRSTLEPTNPVAGRTETVQVRRLDTLAPPPVCFMKIDVEGHEAAVLAGAGEILRRDRPALLIEIEERHKPGATNAIPARLAGLGYQGWFLHESRLRPMAEFNVSEHQVPGRAPYVNNFVFLPSERPNPLL